MHRSGTSAITRTLSLFGAALPTNLLAPSPTENPTGFWESADIVAIHDRFLSAINSHWDDLLPLPDAAFATLAARTCHDELVSLLHRDLEDAPIFVIKDPRLCRLLPLWTKVLASFSARPIAVLSLRDPLSVALSLGRRNEFSLERSLALWLVHSLLAERETRGWQRAFVRYDDLIEAPVEAARSLEARLECFSAQNVEAALPQIAAHWSKSLRHHTPRDSATLNDAALPAWVEQVHGWLVTQDESNVQELDSLWASLTSALEVYGPLVGELSERTERGRALELAVAKLSDENARISVEHDRVSQDAATLRQDLALEQSVSARWKAEAVQLQVRVEILSEMERHFETLRRQNEEALSLLHGAARRRFRLARMPGGRLLKRLYEALWLLSHLDDELFDATYYRETQPPFASWLPARLHYLLVGRRRGASPSRLFDVSYYGRRYPDVIASGDDPFVHYLRYGGCEGRQPSAVFDGRYYLAQNPDVASQQVNPLRHYLTYGWREGRDPNAVFDTSFYLRDGDVKTEPLSHYLRVGAKAGRHPSPLFDGARYLADNLDVALQDENPLVHYLTFGLAEDRQVTRIDKVCGP
jgi:hypothetical protein